MKWQTNLTFPVILDKERDRIKFVFAVYVKGMEIPYSDDIQSLGDPMDLLWQQKGTRRGLEVCEEAPKTIGPPNSSCHTNLRLKDSYKPAGLWSCHLTDNLEETEYLLVRDSSQGPFIR